MRTAAIVLAAGSGRRMGSSLPKQFLELCGHPLLYFTLKTFQDSAAVDEIILVAGRNGEDQCRKIINEYNFRKVSRVVLGGDQRVHSVFNGLEALKNDNIDYVFIQDSARIFLDEQLIETTLEAAKECGASLAAAQVRDTMKQSEDGEYVSSSPDRSSMWIAQTPQTFRYDLIMSCFERYMNDPERQESKITDDVSLVSLYSDSKVRIVRSSFWNMKVTEPWDISVAEALLRQADRRT